MGALLLEKCGACGNGRRVLGEREPWRGGGLGCCGVLLSLLLVHIARGGLEITVALTGLEP